MMRDLKFAVNWHRIVYNNLLNSKSNRCLDARISQEGETMQTPIARRETCLGSSVSPRVGVQGESVQRIVSRCCRVEFSPSLLFSSLELSDTKVYEP